jgi:drug/metabolite transporter (DMT)-like permease
MIALFFSIVSSSLLFVLFKLFPKWKIDTFQAIVFNYFVAFTAGFALYGNEWKATAMHTGTWPWFALLAGFLFITLFLLMGSSSQQNGVGKTSIAVKMSMAMSMLLMMIWYKEHITFLKILGIGLALIGVILVSMQDSQKGAKNGSSWMLIVLFVGSGMLDFVLNYVQKYELNILTPSLFSSIGFGCAGIMGLCVLIYKLIQKKITFHWRNVLAGILLGIPNYFSIYLLLHAYSSTGWNDSTVLAITNVSVVVLSSLMGYFIFRETLTRIKLIGALVAISALVILYFANGSH